MEKLNTSIPDNLDMATAYSDGAAIHPRSLGRGGCQNQGQGYRAYGDGRDKMWLCGRRVISGCPDAPEVK